jgi:hypothetical protein
MLRKPMMLLTALAATAALAAPEARAGVVIVTESEQPAAAKGQEKPATKGGDTTYSGKLFVEGDRVRMQGTQSDKEGDLEGTVIFRPQPEALLILNDDEKTYFEVTRDDAKRIGSAIDTARTQMQAQLEKMTPEQRAMVEQAMGSLGGAGVKPAAKKAAEPPKAVANGATDTVNGFACRGFDVVRSGKKIAEVCVAAWSDLGLAAADVDGLRKLVAFQQQMVAEVGWDGMETAPGAEAFEVMDQIKGFPVRVRSLSGKRPMVMRVVKVERQSIDPTMFQVPSGYSKGVMPTG